jgi:hypothetical protein
VIAVTAARDFSPGPLILAVTEIFRCIAPRVVTPEELTVSWAIVLSGSDPGKVMVTIPCGA